MKSVNKEATIGIDLALPAHAEGLETPERRAPYPFSYSTEDVCKRYDFSRTTLHRLVKKGSFPRPVKIGGPNRWPSTVLKAYEQKLLESSGV